MAWEIFIMYFETYGEYLVGLMMSLYYLGAIVQDAQSSAKRQDAAFGTTRAVYIQNMLII